jgi:hypothetical protein
MFMPTEIIVIASLALSLLLVAGVWSGSSRQAGTAKLVAHVRATVSLLALLKDRKQFREADLQSYCWKISVVDAHTFQP